MSLIISRSSQQTLVQNQPRGSQGSRGKAIQISAPVSPWPPWLDLRSTISPSQSARNFGDALGEPFDLLLKRIAGDELAGHFFDRDGQIDDFVIAPARADLGGIDAEVFQRPFRDRLARGHHNV